MASSRITSTPSNAQRARVRTATASAERLGISRFTARNHAEQILARLKVESRWQVARALSEVVAAVAGARDGPPGSPPV